MGIDETPGARRKAEGRRVHVNTGATCNNSCLFCMEAGEHGRFLSDSSIPAAEVRAILEHNRGAEEVCFTSGEPTLNPELADHARLARELGYRHVSVMTNARMLSHVPTARRLLEAGLDRFYVSVHGHDAKLHDGLTRTPGSFEQTVRGLRVVRALASRLGRPVELFASTVVNKRNLPHLGAIYALLRSLGVERAVFNVMEANGRAHLHFERLFPRYVEIVEAFGRLVAEADETKRGEPVRAVLSDVPPCLTRGLPAHCRGFVEASTHYETTAEAKRLLDEQAAAARAVVGGLLEISRGDIDQAGRSYHPRCSSCRYRAGCDGVWDNYVARMGWDEFVPVP